MPRQKQNTVTVTFKVDGEVKADFERDLTAHGRFHTSTKFWIACMEALSLQMRRGEPPAYPLEFVTEKKK